MSVTRPGEVNNGITTIWVPYSTAGLSVASKCYSGVVGSNSGSSNDRHGHAGERIQCQPTEEAIEPENTTPTRVRVHSSNYSSMSTPTSIPADAAATMILSCPDGFEIRGDMCVPMEEEEPRQAIIARNPGAGDSYVGSRINNARARVRDAGAGKLLPRQSDSISITTTITPILQTPEATESSAAPSSAAASSSSISSSEIISTTSPTPTSSSGQIFTTITSIPLLIATGSYSTIYSIPSTVVPTSTPTASSNSKSSGLSVGAKAGITVSAVFVVIVIGILLAMLHIRRRRKLQNNRSTPSRTQKKEKPQAPRIDRRIDPGIIPEKGAPPPDLGQHPMMGMQATLAPGFMVPYTASSNPIGTHPGTKVEIDNSDRDMKAADPARPMNVVDPGPHELDVGEKFEMEGDAGYPTRESTIDSFPLDITPSMISRGVTPSIASRAVTPSLRDRERAVTPSLRDRSGSMGTMGNVRGMAPSPMSSFSRDRDRDRERDARGMGMGGGHISPMSQTTERTERSFLDLD